MFVCRILMVPNSDGLFITVIKIIIGEYYDWVSDGGRPSFNCRLVQKTMGLANTNLLNMRSFRVFLQTLKMPQ